MKLKNSFVMYHDYWDWFRLLTDEELGKLIRALFLYEKEGSGVNIPDDKLNIIFCIIKDNLDRDKAKYEAICNKNKENAKLRWQK